MAREFLLALGLSALVAGATDWRDTNLSVMGATMLWRANAVVAVVALVLTAWFQVVWPGPQGLSWPTRGALILAGPLSVWVAYQWIYPFLW